MVSVITFGSFARGDSEPDSVGDRGGGPEAGLGAVLGVGVVRFRVGGGELGYTLFS